MDSGTTLLQACETWVTMLPEENAAQTPRAEQNGSSRNLGILCFFYGDSPEVGLKINKKFAPILLA